MVGHRGRPPTPIFGFYLLENIKEWELSQLAVHDSYVYQVCILPGDIGNEHQLCEGTRSHFQVIYVCKSEIIQKTNNLRRNKKKPGSIVHPPYMFRIFRKVAILVMLIILAIFTK